MLELKPVKSSRVRKLVFSGAVLYLLSFLFIFSMFFLPIWLFLLFLFLFLSAFLLFFYRLYRFLLALLSIEAPTGGPEAAGGAAVYPVQLVDFARLILSQSDGGDK